MRYAMDKETNSQVTTCGTCGNTFDASEIDNYPCCDNLEEVKESVTVRITPLPPVLGTTFR